MRKHLLLIALLVLASVGFSQPWPGNSKATRGNRDCVDVTYEFSATACNSYTWNGITYTESGDYVQTFEIGDGMETFFYDFDNTPENYHDWQFLTADDDDYYWDVYSEEGYGHNSSDFLASFSYYDGEDFEPDNFVVLPFANIRSNSRLSFWARQLTDGWEDVLGIFVTTATDITTTADFEQVGSDFTISSGTWTHYTVNLGAYAGLSVGIAFRHYNCYGQHAVLVDDIELYLDRGDAPDNSFNNTIANIGRGERDQFVAAASESIQGRHIESGIGYANIANGAVRETCDSIVTLHLTITGDITYEFDATACSSYTWNGVTYTESGDYVQTFEIEVDNGGEDVIYFFDFDNTPEDYTGWQVLSADDDTLNWAIYSGDGLGHNSSDFLASYSYYDYTDYDPDNFVVLPYTTLSSNSKLSFWARERTNTWEDILGVYVTTATNITSTADFEQIGSDIVLYSEDWTRFTFDLSAYAGQRVGIAFRHYNSYGQHAVMIDDIELYNFSGRVADNNYVNPRPNSVGGERNQFEAAANEITQSSHIASAFGHAYIPKAPVREICDSVVTMHLTITGGVTHEFSATACDSYTWNGVTYSESGYYVQTFEIEIDNGGEEVLYFYDFDNPEEDYTDWQLFDVDGDDDYWGIYTGDGMGHNSSDFLASFSYVGGADIEPDNIVVLPFATYSSNTKLSFWARQLAHGWEDVLGVYVTTSTDITSTADFEQVGSDLTISDSTWVRYTFDLGAYAGQSVAVAFRHYNCFGQYAILIDDIELYNYSGRAAANNFNNTASNVLGERNQQVAAVNALPQGSHIANVLGHANIAKTPVREICDSVVTLHLTINPTLYGDYYADICETELPFTWHGETFDGAGTETITIEEATAAGCDSIVTLHVTVNPTLTGDYYTTVCDAQLPYTWYGVTFDEAGTQIVTLPNATAAGCDSIVTLHLSVNPVLEGDYYASVCEAQLPFTWHGVTFNETSTETITVPNATIEGCDSIITLHVTVSPAMEGDYYATICESELPYTWHGVTFAEAGEETITIEEATAAGCDSIVTLHVTVNPTLMGDYYATICESELPYLWHGVTFAEAGEETVTIEGATAEECDSIVTLHVTVNPTLTGDYYATICESELPFTWHGVTFAEAGEEIITVEGATAQECDSVITLHVTVNPTLTGDYYATICETELPYTWYGATFIGAGTQTVTIEGATAQECDSIVTLHLTVNPTLTADNYVEMCEKELPYEWNGELLYEGGQYSYTVEGATAQECDSIITLTLVVNLDPDVVITGETHILIGSQTTLTASGADTYLWNTGETTASITVSPTEPITTYTVVGTNINGCSSTTQITVYTTDGVGENAFDISIYPNPVKNVVSVEAEGIRNIRLVDMLGQTLYDSDENGDAVQVDMSGFADGVYFMQVKTVNGIVTQKVVKK